MDKHRRRELGPDQLKALTHPVRVRLLRELRSDGPATASLLARRLGESSGLTSYHLRQLEKHGFVEEAPDIGDGRDRWWRPAFGGHHVASEKWLDDPEQAAVLALYESEIVAGHARTADEWVRTQADWGPEWASVSALNDYRLRLTPAQLKRLTETVDETIESFRAEQDAAPDGAETVNVTFYAFPRRPRPFTQDES